MRSYCTMSRDCDVSNRRCPGKTVAMLLIANLVRTVAAVVVGIIVIAIVLVLLGASTHNDIVSWLRDAAAWLAGPFAGIFHFDSEKATLAVNWGIAAIVYAVVAGLISSLLARAGGAGYGRRSTAY